MNKGKVLVAEENGVYLLKLCGDVRLTLCLSITDYIQNIFKNKQVKEVYVDLCEAECIDSTSLGLLAKLAIHTEKYFNLKTHLLCVNNDILRVFEAMDIDSLFDILGDSSANNRFSLEEAAPQEIDENTIREQVLEAHKLLISLNPKLKSEFYDLISSLESTD